MKMNFSKFPVSVLTEEVQKDYDRLYGDAGRQIVDTLNESPNEIAVISRMIAFLKEKKGA